MARTGRSFPQSTGATSSPAAWVTPYAPPSGSKWLAWKVVSTAGTNATLIKQASALLGPIVLTNTSGATRYLKLFNATTLALGTDTPTLTIEIPATAAEGPLSWRNDKGFTFGTGLCFALTTGAADNDTGAVGAAEVTGVICWF